MNWFATSVKNQSSIMETHPSHPEFSFRLGERVAYAFVLDEAAESSGRIRSERVVRRGTWSVAMVVVVGQ